MPIAKGKRRMIMELLAIHGELTGADLIRLEPELHRASTYVTLARLEEDGWLQSRYEKIPGEQTRTRRFFVLTSLGENVLELDRQQARIQAGVVPSTAHPASPGKRGRK